MKKEKKKSYLGFMLKVAELGLLRSNIVELSRMELFMKGVRFGKNGIWKITDNQILYSFWEDDHFSPVYDITIEVLTDLYGTDNERREAIDDGYTLDIEYGCYDYMIDKNFEADLHGFEIVNKEVE